MAGNMSSSQAADCFESDVYTNATLRYNASSAGYIATDEPWKSFTSKESGYTDKVSFTYNGTTINLTQQADGSFRYENGSGELQTLYLKDNVAISAPVDFVANVSYDRTFGTDTWCSTLYLPFSAPKPEGWTLYTFAPAQTSTEGKVALEEADAIEAFTPCLVKVTASGTLPVQEVTIKAGHKNQTIANGDYSFTGTIDGLTGDNYVPSATEWEFTKNSAALQRATCRHLLQ